MKVAIVGKGKMGTELKKRLSDHCDIYIVERERGREYLSNVDIVILALPGNEISSFLNKHMNCLSNGQIIVNISTLVTMDHFDHETQKSLNIVAAKIIGHAGSMAQGIDPLVAVSGHDEKGISMVCNLFQKVGKVVKLPEEAVKDLNIGATRKGLELIIELEKQVEKLCDDKDTGKVVLDVTIDNVVAGVMKAYRSGELGGFAKSLINK